ncbi:MAG: glutamate--cysteine ligase [Cellvibrionaceae bacterium]
MGIDIDRIEFNEHDYHRFQKKLEEQLLSLQQRLNHPNFGTASPAIGAELELYIVDKFGHPLSENETILSLADNPLLTPELNSYNLEYNLAPCKVSNNPFSTLEKAITDQLAILNQYANTVNGRMVPIGILPTLTQDDLGLHCMTQRKRYHALVNQLIKQRGTDFKIDINGQNPLKFNLSDITLEGANTSFQIHYQVSPKNYADTYNSMQLVTPLVLALSANSPTLFGHSLWDETRIPLFKQSIDTRHIDRYQWNEPARVNFGHGWLRKGAYELFSEAVELYEPIIPVIQEDMGNSDNPCLAELCLHQGTVWFWNRPVYDSVEGGHLRIEMRALPSGPTAIDMMANAAFLIGLAEGYRQKINDILPAIPFQTAEYNFYRSAQFSLDAEIIWPLEGIGYQRLPIITVIENNLTIAKQGLLSIGIKESEVNYYLAVIEKRINREKNGAIWQKSTLKELNKKYNTVDSLHKMLDIFIHNSQTNTPIAEWNINEKLG